MTQSMEKAEILLATCLDSDGWLSMDRCNTHILKEFASYADRFTVRHIRPPLQNVRSRLVRGFVRRVVYPATVRRAMAVPDGRRLLHVTDQFYAYLLREGRPCVGTCHDVAEFAQTDLSPSEFARWKMRVEHLMHADLVFADSTHTASDLAAAGIAAPDRILVNHLGLGDGFRRLPPDHKWSSEVARILDTSKGSPLVLHVGVNLSRKNVPTLLEAISLVRKSGQDVRLVKVGDFLGGGSGGEGFSVEKRDGKYSDLVSRLDIAGAVFDLGRVEDSVLLELYNACAMMSLPSLCEGFGLTVLEAQACGCPCVLARASSLPEVGGDAALYHDPRSAQELADCLARLAKDEGLRQSLVVAGLENVKKFTWAAHVDRLVQGYGRALGT